MIRQGCLRFLHCDFIAHCEARVDKYFEGYYTIQLMTSGAVELFYGDTRYLLEGAWFWPAFPGPRIRFHPGANQPWWEHRYVAFQGPLVNEWKAVGLWLDAPQAARDLEHVRACFDALLTQARRADQWGSLRSINLLECLLLELAEQRRQFHQHEPWLEHVLTSLAHIQDFTPDYAQLARECGLGLSTLRRRFKEATGLSLHSYVLQKRLSAACTLLGESDLPIKVIAERLGYRDIYFFSRQFRTLMGSSPALYRKSRQR